MNKFLIVFFISFIGNSFTQNVVTNKIIEKPNSFILKSISVDDYKMTGEIGEDYNNRMHYKFHFDLLIEKLEDDAYFGVSFKRKTLKNPENSPSILIAFQKYKSDYFFIIYNITTGILLEEHKIKISPKLYKENNFKILIDNSKGVIKCGFNDEMMVLAENSPLFNFNGFSLVAKGNTAIKINNFNFISSIKEEKSEYMYDMFDNGYDYKLERHFLKRGSEYFGKLSDYVPEVFLFDNLYVQRDTGFDVLTLLNQLLGNDAVKIDKKKNQFGGDDYVISYNGNTLAVSCNKEKYIQSIVVQFKVQKDADDFYKLYIDSKLFDKRWENSGVKHAGLEKFTFQNVSLNGKSVVFNLIGSY